MEYDKSQNRVTRTTRSATRSAAKAMTIQGREPIRQTKRRRDKTPQEEEENGAQESNDASGDSSSPQKKRHLEEVDGMGCGEDNGMEVEPEELVEKHKLQDKGVSLDSLHPGQQPEVVIGSAQMSGPFEVYSLNPSLLACSQSGPSEDVGLLKNTAVEPSRHEHVSFAKSALPLGSQDDRPQIQRTKSRSTADYQETMAKARGVLRGVHYVPTSHSKSVVPCQTQQRVNNVSQQKRLIQRKSPVVKKAAIKPAVKVIHGSSPRGFCWYLTRVLCLLLLSAAILLAYRKASALQNLTNKVKPGEFLARWSDLQSQFPGQRPELWKRGRVHLERHLRTARPTEPVSLILAAGRGGERTLHCLARGMASAFSAAHNASVLHIDGAAAGRDSDQVKMDIDSELQGAFGGDRPAAAVIHRLEELPPGATLIFYRYCDHENAAYKQVFLAFTVLLPQDHLETQHSLKEVEERVQDYVADRFVGSDGQRGFDRMDVDKLSGLWSRISHLVLPVAAESQVERNGCEPSHD